MGRRGKKDERKEKRRMVSPDGYLDYFRLILQCKSRRTFHGNNIMTDFSSRLLPGPERAMVYSCHQAEASPPGSVLGSRNTPRLQEESAHSPRHRRVC